MTLYYWSPTVPSILNVWLFPGLTVWDVASPSSVTSHGTLQATRAQTSQRARPLSQARCSTTAALIPCYTSPAPTRPRAPYDRNSTVPRNLESKTSWHCEEVRNFRLVFALNFVILCIELESGSPIFQGRTSCI